MSCANLMLASTSPYRRELLARLGLPFVVEAPRVAERRRAGEDPGRMAARLAREKAVEVAARHPSALVIGSDQTAELDGALLRKPGSAAANVEQLAHCSGRVVTFHTGLCLHHAPDGRQWLDVGRVRVRFRTLRKRWIEHYVNAERAWDCAGGFRFEGLGIALFEGIETDDPTALIGLPLIRLSEMLRAAGCEVLGGTD